MRTRFLCFGCCIMMASVLLAAERAFPGAEGWAGVYARRTRGRILPRNYAGSEWAGSFAEAVNTPGPEDCRL
jgi:hypothetical protein